MSDQLKNNKEEAPRKEEGGGVERETAPETPFFSDLASPKKEPTSDSPDIPADLSDDSKWKDVPCVDNQLTDQKYEATYRIKGVYCGLFDLEKKDQLEQYQDLLTKAVGPRKSIHVALDEFPQPGYKIFFKYVQYEFYDFIPKRRASRKDSEI